MTKAAYVYLNASLIYADVTDNLWISYVLSGCTSWMIVYSETMEGCYSSVIHVIAK